MGLAEGRREGHICPVKETDFPWDNREPEQGFTQKSDVVRFDNMVTSLASIL